MASIPVDDRTAEYDRTLANRRRFADNSAWMDYRDEIGRNLSRRAHYFFALRIATDRDYKLRVVGHVIPKITNLSNNWIAEDRLIARPIIKKCNLIPFAGLGCRICNDRAVAAGPNNQ